jgi:deazaflavin-dependent oxidoreductase (nitroreductase family)
MDKRRVTTTLATRTLNPVVKGAAALGIRPPGVVVLETIGRKSGKRRRTPVGGRLEDSTVWIVAEHGRRAGFVRNIAANPRVRVKVGRRWREGTAHLMADDDPRLRLRQIGHRRAGLKLNSLVVRAMATDMRTVRIDLDD